MARAPGQHGLFGGIEPPHRYETGVRSPKAAGYAAPPGTGPEGQTCGTCAHCHVRSARRTPRRRFYKCGLRIATWNTDRSSDVLVSSPACRLFEAGTPTESTAAHVRNTGWDD